MSNIYNLEPPTKGKVVLKTNMGDLDIELWPKEAPKAVRNFVQLCMEGYYDGTIFHRLIPNYMMQGGDPTGTGSGGESIYGAPFKDEFHSRLRFNHRGIVACANANAPHTNGSQFFITLDKAEWLDKKNTIFGKVTGDTIYNLVKMGEIDVNEADDRPTDPPVIQSVEILWEPFDDIVPRTTAEERRQEKVFRQAEEARAVRKAAKKNLSLLSFGAEAEEDEGAMQAAGRTKIRSAHEVLDDERLAKAGEVPQEDAAETSRRKAAAGRVKGALSKATDAAGGAAGADVEADVEADADTGGDFAAVMRGRMMQKRRERGDAAPRRPPESASADAAGGGERGDAAHDAGRASSSSGGDSDTDSGADADADTAAQRAVKRRRETVEAFRLEGKKRTVGRVKATEEVADANLLKPHQIQREKYKQRKRLLGDREKDTMARLAKFTAALRTAGKSTAAAGGGATASTDREAAAAAAAGDGAAAGGGRDDTYDGQVSKEIDHRSYMPAAWRVDAYLDDPGQDATLAELRSHKLEFAKAPGGAGGGAADPMARRDDVDDLVVYDPLLEKGKGKYSKAAQAAKKKQTEWRAGPHSSAR